MNTQKIRPVEIIDKLNEDKNSDKKSETMARGKVPMVEIIDKKSETMVREKVPMVEVIDKANKAIQNTDNYYITRVSGNIYTYDTNEKTNNLSVNSTQSDQSVTKSANIPARKGIQMVQKLPSKSASTSDEKNIIEMMKNSQLRNTSLVNMPSNSTNMPYFHAGFLYVDGIPRTNFFIQIDEIKFLYTLNDTASEKRIDLTVVVIEGGRELPHKFRALPLSKAMDASLIEKVPFARQFFEKKSEMNDFFYRYMSRLINTYSGLVIKILSRAGWEKGLHDYVTADGAIAHPEQLVRADGNLHIRNLFNGCIYPDYCHMLATIKEPGKMQAVLSYVLASFLHSVFEDAGFPMKHALFIVGPRGSKKTSVAQCFTQLGDDRRTVRFNFTATESGIQYNLQHYADRVMLIDDLAPSTDYSDKKRKEKMLESILRLCGDSGERVINTAFMKTGAEQIDYRVRGGIVITGEYFYGTGSESSIARAVVVNLEKDSVENTLLSHFQTNPEIIESLIFRFLKFVGLNYDQTIYTIRSTMEQIRGSSVNYHFSNARYVDYLGQYMTIANILQGLFAAEGNVFDGNAFLADFHNNITELLKENDKKMRSQAPIDILLSAIVQEINSGSVAQWGSPFSEDIRLIRGEDAFYLRQMDLPGILKDYAKKNNIHTLPLSSTELGRLLEVHGYCETVMEGGQKRRGKRFKEYGKDRLMCIPMEKIAEFEKNQNF